MPKKNYQVFLTENDIATLNKIRKMDIHPQEQLCMPISC